MPLTGFVVMGGRPIVQGLVVEGFVRERLGVWDALFVTFMSVCIRRTRNVKLFMRMDFVMLREGVLGNLILVRVLAALLQVHRRTCGMLLSCGE